MRRSERTSAPPRPPDARPAPRGRSSLWDALLVFEIALVIRLLYFAEFRRSPFFDFLHLDPLYYHDWALRIAGGDWIGKEVFEQSPLYPYLLAVYFTLFGHGLTLLRLIQFLLGAVTAALTCLLGRRLFDRAAGLVAGLGAAIYAPFLFYEGQVMKEFLTPFFTVTLLLLFLRGIGDGARRWIFIALSGICIGATALVRDNALLLLPVLGIYLIIARRKAGGIAMAGWLAAGCAVVLLPVAVRNHFVSGDWVLTTSGGGEVFYIGNGPYATGAYSPPPWVRPEPAHEHEDFRRRAREIAGHDLSRAEASRFWYREGWRTISEHLGAWPLLLLRKAALFLNDHELADNYSFYSFGNFSWTLTLLPTFGWVAMLAAPGLIASASRWRELIPLYLVGAGYMASVILFFNFARFRLPFIIALLPFAGEGAVVLARTARGFLAPGDRLKDQPRASLKQIACGVAAVAALAGTNVRIEAGIGESLQADLNLAAAWRASGRLPEAEQSLAAAVNEAEDLVERRGWKGEIPSSPDGVVVRRSLHDAHRALAEILAARSRNEDAIPHLLAASEADPHDADLYDRLARLYNASGDSRSAASAYERGLAANPDSLSLRLSRAAFLYERGDPAAAREDLLEARRRRPDLDDGDLADWSYAMGIVLEALPAHRSEAPEHLRKALELNPTHPQAARARNLLQ